MILQLFVDRYLKVKYPNVGLTSTFKLPLRIDTASVETRVRWCRSDYAASGQRTLWNPHPSVALRRSEFSPERSPGWAIPEGALRDPTKVPKARCTPKTIGRPGHRLAQLRAN